MPTDLKDGNRNLPGTSTGPVGGPDDGSISPKELAEFDQITAGISPNDTEDPLAYLAREESPAANPIQGMVEDDLGISSGGPTSPGPKTSSRQGSDSKLKPGSSSSKTPTGSSLGKDSEAKSLSDTLDKYNQEWIKDIGNKIEKTEGEKVGRLNIRGRARKKVKLLLLGAIFAFAAAVPVGILGVIPHAMQSWIQGRVADYTERAVDKMGQRVLYMFIRDRVAIDKCKGAYSSGAEIRCRPRLNERDSRLSQLFNDWHAAKMEDRLAKHGINVEYDPAELSAGGKPYKITIDGVNFKAAEDFGSPDWDITKFSGKREASLMLKKASKEALKGETRWNKYLARRNLKAYLRDLGLPGKFWLGEKAASKLDDFDVGKSKLKTRFRQYLTQFVVSKGPARTGALLEILLSGDSSKGTPSKIRENNKVLSLAASKIGKEKLEKLLSDYAGKNLTEIQIKMVENLIAKLSEKLAEKFGQAAANAIPVIGWVLLAFTVLDMIDLGTDGTLQHWVSATNANSMLDTANLMDTMVSEEKKGLVDLQSAGDSRLSLVNGLSSSRVFANTIGYKSPSGKKAGGYNCKPSTSLTDLSSIMGATGEVFGDGDATSGPQLGMANGQDTCDNHRVDYDPLSAFGGAAALAQASIGMYTEDCAASIFVGFGFPDIPGVDCPSLQEIYHGAQGGISWLAGKLGGNWLSTVVSSFGPVKWFMAKATTWITNAITIFVTGGSLAGPELLQGGRQTDTKSGARIFDAWSGGNQVSQFDFAKGVGDGGGLGGIPLSGSQAAELNESIAAERKEELASGSFFDRMFDISHVDTLASGVMGLAVTEGGVNNLINPMSNLSLAFSGLGTDAFADTPDPDQALCSDTNDKGDAVTEFGVVCYAVPDDYIDNLTDEEIQDLSDPEFCSSHTAEIDAARKKSEEDGLQLAEYPNPNTDPDGTGRSTQIDGCRLMGTVTDVMGTNFRTDDKIFGFENQSSSGTASVTLDGVECPAGELETKQVGSTTYYKMPEDPAYGIYSSDGRRFGSKELICTLYTVGKAYNTAMNGTSKLNIGDLNAGYPHESHTNGTAVDMQGMGDVVSADRTSAAYSTEATVILGKLFIDTGMVRNIWWCPTDDSTSQILAYAQSIGKPIEGQMKCISGHDNHFHVDIKYEFRGADPDKP